jgi:hexosaminidase
MIDTARHYLPEETILRVLDGMMYSKFNLLHWHIVDDQSFPYVSTKFPELSDKGAYHKNAVYTPETIQRIQQAALHRGIRVMLEFDTPGHTHGFGKSHPEFLTPCHGESKDGSSINIADRINFDPSNEEMYAFMREFFTEVVQNVTNNKLLHIGMDEVYGECWESSPKIQEFMRQNNYTDWRQVQGHYTKKHVEMIKSLGVTPVAWQDPMDDGVELDKDVIIHIWKFYEWLPWPETLSKALKLGHKVIFSACWYINLIDYGQSWREYYECDPVEGADTEGYEDQILGGEAAIWGEFVDQTNIEARLFPYASAVAGVLWTDRDGLPDTDNAMWALHDFGCKLLRRGIRAQPLLNGYCGPFEVDLDM